MWSAVQPKILETGGLSGGRRLVDIADEILADALRIDEPPPPTIFFLGGGMGAGKDRLMNLVHATKHYQKLGPVVTVAADALKASDAQAKLSTPRFVVAQGRPRFTSTAAKADAEAALDSEMSSIVSHSASVRSAEHMLLSAVMQRQHIVFDGTMSWAPFIMQTIAMVRDPYSHWACGPGFFVSTGALAQRGRVAQIYWRPIAPRNPAAPPYRVVFLGVMSDPNVAVTRALLRQRATGRAVPFKEQLVSHVLFGKMWRTYAAVADVAIVVDNTPENADDPILVACKSRRSAPIRVDATAAARLDASARIDVARSVRRRAQAGVSDSSLSLIAFHAPGEHLTIAELRMPAVKFPPLPPATEQATSRPLGPLAPWALARPSKANWVVPGVVAVGASPAPAPPALRAEVHDALLDAGLNVFVSLQTTRELFEAGPYANELRAMAAARGSTKPLYFYHLPVPDLNPPMRTQAILLCNLLLQLIACGNVVYLHCTGGHGRSACVAAILMGVLYRLDAPTAMRYLKLFHALRVHPGQADVGTPQTLDQRAVIYEILEGPARPIVPTPPLIDMHALQRRIYPRFPGAIAPPARHLHTVPGYVLGQAQPDPVMNKSG